MIKMRRDADGAVHWITIGPKLTRAFGDRGTRYFSERDWLQHIYEGSNKTRFEYCENSKNSLMYIRVQITDTLVETSWPGNR